MSRNRTIKDKTAEANRGRHISIRENLEKEMEWKLWPSSCVNGEVFIIFHGHKVPYQEFIELQPNPNVGNYNADITNVDSTTTALL